MRAEVAATKEGVAVLLEKVNKLETSAVLPSADQTKMDSLLNLVPMIEHRMIFLIRDRKKLSNVIKFSFEELTHPWNEETKRLFKDYIHLLCSVVPSWIKLDSSKHSLIRVDNLNVHEVRDLINRYYISSKVDSRKHNAEVRAIQAETKAEELRIQLALVKEKLKEQSIQHLEIEMDKEEQPPIVPSDTESEEEEKDPIGAQLTRTHNTIMRVGAAKEAKLKGIEKQISSLK